MSAPIPQPSRRRKLNRVERIADRERREREWERDYHPIYGKKNSILKYIINGYKWEADT